MAGGNKFTQALIDAEAGLEIIHEKLRLIQQDTIKGAEAVNALISSANKATPNGAGNKTKAMVQNVGGLTKVVTENNSVIADMISLEKQKQTELAKGERLQDKVNKQIERNLKLTQKEYDLNQKKARSYNKVNAALRRMKDDYRDLQVRKQLNMKLTEKEEKRMLRLEKSIMKVDRAMKTTDSKMGVHTRSVGNYGKAFDSLGFSVAQITRESPAFINSMQTGFMAISNNIPTLVDELDKLKFKNAQLIKDGGKATPVWKSLGKAVFSYQSAISMAILALTVFAPMLIKWAQGLDAGAKAAERLEERTAAVNKELAEATTELPLLVKEIQNHTGSEKARLEMIDELTKSYPDFNAQLLVEKDNTILVNAELTKYIKLQRLRIESQKDVDRLIELNQELVDVEKELSEATMSERDMANIARFEAERGVGLTKLTQKQEKNLDLQSKKNRIQKEQNALETSYLDKATEINEMEVAKQGIIDKTIAHYKDLISKNQDRIDNKLTLLDLDEIAVLKGENAEYKKQIELIGGVNKKKKEEIVYFKGQIGHYEKLIAANTAQMKFAKSTEMYDKLVKENYQLQEMINLIKGVKSEWEKMFDADEELNNPFKAMSFEDFEKKTLRLDDIVEIVEDEDVFGDYVDGFLPMFQKMGDGWGTLTKLLGKDTNQLESEFMDMYTAMGGDPEDTKKMEKEFAKFMSMQEEKVVNLLGKISDTVNAAADLGTALIERNIEELEQEKTAIEERYDMEMLKAEETATSKEQLADKQMILEKQKAKDMRLIQDKINKEKKKQAIIDKAAAVATIAINTAIGVSAAIAKGAIFNSAEVILTLAIGALQTAMVLATPIPQYAMGTENHKGGKAMVGDGGKHEAIITPDGSIFKSPNKDTIMDLPSGTKVKPDYDKFMAGASESQKQLYDSRLLRGLAMNAIAEKKDDRVLDAIRSQTEVLREKKLSSTMINKGQDFGQELWKLKQTSW